MGVGLTFYKGCFFIVMVALLMTIFETIVYVVLIVPEEKATIADMLDGVGGTSKLASLASAADGAAVGIPGKLASAFAVRERHNTDVLNTNLVIMIVFECLVFLALLAAIATKVYTFSGPGIVSVLPPTINAVLTSLVLMAFQGLMYFMAHDWEYPDTEELGLKILVRAEEMSR